MDDVTEQRRDERQQHYEPKWVWVARRSCSLKIVVRLLRSNMVVAMAQQIEEGKVTKATVDSPGILEPHGLISTCGFPAARQAVVLYIVRPLEAKNSHETLEQEKDAGSPAEEAHTEGEPKC